MTSKGIFILKQTISPAHIACRFFLKVRKSQNKVKIAEAFFECDLLFFWFILSFYCLFVTFSLLSSFFFSFSFSLVILSFWVRFWPTTGRTMFFFCTFFILCFIVLMFWCRIGLIVCFTIIYRYWFIYFSFSLFVCNFYFPFWRVLFPLGII